MVIELFEILGLVNFFRIVFPHFQIWFGNFKSLETLTLTFIFSQVAIHHYIFISENKYSIYLENTFVWGKLLRPKYFGLLGWWFRWRLCCDYNDNFRSWYPTTEFYPTLHPAKVKFLLQDVLLPTMEFSALGCPIVWNYFWDFETHLCLYLKSFSKKSHDFFVVIFLVKQPFLIYEGTCFHPYPQTI